MRLSSIQINVNGTEQSSFKPCKHEARGRGEVTEHDILSCFVDIAVTSDHNETLAVEQICKAEHPKGLRTQG